LKELLDFAGNILAAIAGGEAVEHVVPELSSERFL
jgi:hypothetical protein